MQLMALDQEISDAFDVKAILDQLAGCEHPHLLGAQLVLESVRFRVVCPRCRAEHLVGVDEVPQECCGHTWGMIRRFGG